ncbi:MAG: site-specific integrase [Oculatellaceae cyanobacterium Prado106]|nr:site-specific integrase [Oculatellaceae cyanobacterium Prado106]
MYSREKIARSSKGSVQFKNTKGRLQIVFSYPVQIANGEFERKRFYISTGYDDTPLNRQRVGNTVRILQRDIDYGEVDLTLQKYSPIASLSASAIPPISPNPPEPDPPELQEFWEKYTAFKRRSLSPSTIAKDYVRVAHCIQNEFPSRKLKDAVLIRDWLVANKTPDTAKRLLTQLSACCKWSMKSQLTGENPFKGMAADIKVPKGDGNDEDTDINPFTLEERDRIIAAFRGDRHFSCYAPLIEFLFMTGCRPSEAVALQWQHISADYRTIRFEQAIVVSENGLVCKKGLKTQKKRMFPANGKLAAMLAAIKPAHATGDTKVFPSPRDTWIDVHNLTNRGWQKILKQLDGIEYRKLYQTRHTFITAALETVVTMADGKVKMLDAKDVARLVGTSPKMIYEHYAGQSRDLFVPEF